MTEVLPILAALLVTLTSLTLLVVPDWRISIGALTIQYAGVFLLVSLEWPISMAIIKLVAGWMASAVMGITLANIFYFTTETRPGDSSFVGKDQRPFNSTRLEMGGLFSLLAAILIGLVVLSQTSLLEKWFPGIRIEQAWGGLILIAMGLLQLSFATHTFPTVLGILTTLAGFEILYAMIEASPLSVGLLAVIHMGLALICAFLLATPFTEEIE